MAEYDYDLFVIGAGSGGVRAARIAAGHGARVAICESYRVGGTCVIRGCVPKKLMVYASQFSEEFAMAREYGWNVTAGAFNWSHFRKAMLGEVDRLNGIYHKLLDNAGVETLMGKGEILDENTVAVDGKSCTARRILIAVGGNPVLPDIPGIEHACTSNDVFHFEQQPERVVVIGGGYIAVEFAGIFNAMGSATRIIYRGDQILRGFDADVRRVLAREMQTKGIAIHNQTTVESIRLDHDERVLTLNTGDEIRCDQVIYATGRAPATENLGLENAGVYTRENGSIPVDRDGRTNVESIFAVGDVTDRIQLTPMAIKEGHAFADTFYGENSWVAEHDLVPSAVFSQPPVASVGLTEGEAHTLKENIDIYFSEFRPMKYTLTGKEHKMMMKLVVCRDTDAVLGCHIVGPDGPEIIQGIAVAMKAGVSKAGFDRTVGVHPTAAEELVTMRTPARSGH